MPRDSQRSKVYKAERQAFWVNGCSHHKGCLLCKRYEDWDVLKKRVNQLLSSKWLLRKYNLPQCFAQVGVLTPGRGTTYAYARRSTLVWGWRMNLPVWARCDHVILHEITHLVTPEKVPAHGREFAKNYLELVRHWMGREAHDRLRKHYVQNRVKYRKKKKLSAETLERLRQHGRALAAMKKGDKC